MDSISALKASDHAFTPSGGEAWLTLDLGNSATKVVLWPWRATDEERPWRTWEVRPLARRAWEAGEVRQQAELQRSFGRWLEELREQLPEWSPVGASISSVAGEQRGELWRATLARNGLQLTEPEPGIQLELRHPETCGMDRQFAARGAVELLGRSCVVLDAGTALTVDAVRWEAGEPARFLGGAIAPGPELLAKSLAEGGARLWRIEPDPRAAALGQDTESALTAGCSVGFRGAARELARAVGLEAGLSDAARVFTGGARGFLLEPHPVWTGSVVEEADLVHRGLWCAQRGPLVADASRP